MEELIAETDYQRVRGQLMENKEKLKIEINEFVGTVIDKVDKLDYFHIEISNHQGNLDMKYIQKN